MTPTAPERKVRDLTGMLTHAGHVLSTRLAAALGEIGLSPRMQCVLVHALERERTQIELAQLAHLDKTTMVDTVDQLEAAGYAERRPSSTDRRARIVTVTESGRRMAVAGQEIVDRVHAEVLAEVLSDAESEVFVGALSRLLEGPLAAPAGPGPTVRRARGR